MGPPACAEGELDNCFVFTSAEKIKRLLKKEFIFFVIDQCEEGSPLRGAVDPVGGL